MKPVSEGTKSAQAINAALEVRELQGEEAVDSILSDFTDLELVPIPDDADFRRLRRAGMTVDQARIVLDFQRSKK